MVRPDSGDPATVVLQLLEIFEQKFGTKKNAMGFKVLPRFIRILQVINELIYWTVLKHLT